jgi:single-strand DNA-binding protein
MASLNKVMLIGNVTRDPEVKYTPKGSAVADIGLAINRTYQNQGGEKVEEVTYLDVELWGRLAEIAGEYAKKGRSIFIEGRLRMDSWEDKQSGQKRNRLKVVGEGLQLLGSRPSGPSGSAGTDVETETSTSRPSRAGFTTPAQAEQADDDIPF